MPDQKLTQLPSDVTPSSTDLAYSVKDPGGTPSSRRVTWAAILALMPWANTSQRGTVELSNQAETQARLDGTRAVTPASLLPGITTVAGPTYTLLATDANGWVRVTGACDITVPDNALVDFSEGDVVYLVIETAGVVSIVEDTAVTVVPPPGGTLVAPGQGAVLVLRYLGADLWSLVAPPQTATDAQVGLTELATPAEAVAGTADDLAVTPEGLTDHIAASPIREAMWCPPVAGQFLHDESGAASITSAMANEVVYWIECYVGAPTALDAVVYNLTAAGVGGTVVGVGIYSAHPTTRRPYELIVDAGTGSGTSIAVHTVTFASTVIPAGMFYVALSPRGGTPTLTVQQNGFSRIPRTNGTTFSWGPGNFTWVQSAQPSFPATATPGVSITWKPKILMRAG